MFANIVGIHINSDCVALHSTFAGLHTAPCFIILFQLVLSCDNHINPHIVRLKVKCPFRYNSESDSGGEEEGDESRKRKKEWTSPESKKPKLS